MKTTWFMMAFALSSCLLAADEPIAPVRGKVMVPVVLEVIGYHPSYRREYFQPVDGTMFEKYFDLLDFKVLSPADFANKEFELYIPSMSGSYMNPAVEFQEKIEVQIDSAELIALLKVDRPEHSPGRSYTIEQAIRTAITSKKQKTNQSTEATAGKSPPSNQSEAPAVPHR